jgi:hypothetical protein
MWRLQDEKWAPPEKTSSILSKLQKQKLRVVTGVKFLFVLFFHPVQ